jgi:hypothetical protein
VKGRAVGLRHALLKEILRQGGGAEEDRLGLSPEKVAGRRSRKKQSRPES